jgi:hypothetical protein
LCILQAQEDEEEEEGSFNANTDPSDVGRLVRMRKSRDSGWVYGAAVWVETKWNAERTVEQHTGWYQIIYGRFNDEDAAQAALLKVIAREKAGEEVLDEVR